jgi:hypothetical protein
VYIFHFLSSSSLTENCQILTAEILIFFSNIVLKCKHLLESQFKGKRGMLLVGLSPPPLLLWMVAKAREKAWDNQSTIQCLPCVAQLMTDGLLFIIFKKAGKPISSQLSSSCQGNRYSTERGRRNGPSITVGSLSSSQPSEPPCWASPLAFGLIGQSSVYWNWGPLLHAV